jgi:hypothetical protein
MIYSYVCIYIYTYDRGVAEGALNLNSTGYLDYGSYGDLPLKGKISMKNPEIEPGTSWSVVRSSDHQATRLVSLSKMFTT